MPTFAFDARAQSNLIEDREFVLNNEIYAQKLIASHAKI
jgi:hypothetical protein